MHALEKREIDSRWLLLPLISLLAYFGGVGLWTIALVWAGSFKITIYI